MLDWARIPVAEEIERALRAEARLMHGLLKRRNSSHDYFSGALISTR
jgi:hypothetical protein